MPIVLLYCAFACVCSALVHRANEWLGRHATLSVVNVEVVEVSGVYGAGSGCIQSVKTVSETALPAYLKMLRFCYSGSIVLLVAMIKYT